MSAINAPTDIGKELHPSKSPAVLLVDDHDLFRTGLRQLLESHGVRVVGDTRCDTGAIDMGRRTKATVALFDIRSSGQTSTTDIVDKFTTSLDQVGVIILSRSCDEIDIYQAIRAGAQGYLDKSAPIEQVAAAIRAVHSGSAWMQPEMLAIAIKFIRTGVFPQPEQPSMSDRETEVLRLIAAGLDNNDIAATLGISSKTVKNHVSSILMKLGLTNRVQAAVFAVRSGLA